MSMYSDEELLAYRDKINSQISMLVSLHDATTDAGEVVSLDQSKVGRLSRMDALQAQAMAKATAHRRQIELIQLRNALKRIDDGSFGDCLECFDFIDPRRVARNPAVTLCFSCATAAENR